MFGTIDKVLVEARMTLDFETEELLSGPDDSSSLCSSSRLPAMLVQLDGDDGDGAHDLADGTCPQTPDGALGVLAASGVVAATTAVHHDFTAAYFKPLEPVLIASPLRLRVTTCTRRAAASGDEALVHKRSARLAAKCKNSLRQPEAQARKVMMKKAGVDVVTELPDEASFEEF